MEYSRHFFCSLLICYLKFICPKEAEISSMKQKEKKLMNVILMLFCINLCIFQVSVSQDMMNIIKRHSKSEFLKMTVIKLMMWPHVDVDFFLQISNQAFRIYHYKGRKFLSF
ncbi:CLUMA_CG011879, isoform A [Clunio marinus]|uniref:CLUMA_CG011879, isoform A n=1 Tax=Clunio marinus TaxID=568069 RepID=A0A1J1IHL3_9DIPT|nr:CLUMA_CG011879, isoform A [Clunio marinus]